MKSRRQINIKNKIVENKKKNKRRKKKKTEKNKGFVGFVVHIGAHLWFHFNSSLKKMINVLYTIFIAQMQEYTRIKYTVPNHSLMLLRVLFHFFRLLFFALCLCCCTCCVVVVVAVDGAVHIFSNVLRIYFFHLYRKKKNYIVFIESGCSFICVPDCK